jgi:demethylmenaquinone methyltransferase/2-methoxy-6-polyprenyl-1,4-benzoquinol methylase
MSNASAEIQGIFNRIAPVYDKLNDRLSFGIHRLWKQMTVKWSGARPGHLCLDLCCGSGDLALLLAREVGTKGMVFGVDFSVEQLAIARSRNKPFSSKLSPIVWLEGDALDLPFADNYFDAATMGYGLRNVLDIPRCLQELHRVLKPEASAAILDFHRPSNVQMRQFQQWYLDYFVVPAAKTMGLTQEYAYISPSLDKFPTGREQVAIAYKAGFVKARHYPIAGAIMGVLTVTKV